MFKQPQNWVYHSWKLLMWSPDPWCRKCERHPAGSGVLWSAPSASLTARFCGGPRSLPASEEAPSTSEACGWTWDCRTSREQDMTVTHIKYCKCRLICSIWKQLRCLHWLSLPMAGAVHRLECEDFFFHGEGEHVFTVVLPVAWCLPQFAVVDVGRGHFLKASSPVLILAKQQKTT